MSNKLAQFAEAINAQASYGEDMNEKQVGGGSKKLPPGSYLGRIIEYTDLGLQPQEFQGKAKDPAKEFRLGVALWGEGVSEPDGSPYIVRPFPVALSRYEKSNCYRMFKALNYTQNPNIKHFAQFLGQAFIFRIEDYTNKAGKTSSIINWALTTAAIQPIGGQPYDVPQVADDLYRIFLWDHPSLVEWALLEIEGTNDDGKSKNFIQETIVGALDFPGSALETLLHTSGVVVPAKAVAAPAPAVAVPQPVAQVAVPAGVAVAAPVVQQVAVPQPVAQAVAPTLTIPAVAEVAQVASPLVVQASPPVTVAQPAPTLPAVASPATVQTVPTTMTSPSEPAAVFTPAVQGVPNLPPVVQS